MCSAGWWTTPLDRLIDDSDPDTHYWFIDAAQGHDLDMRTAIVGQIAQKIEAALTELGPRDPRRPHRVIPLRALART